MGDPRADALRAELSRRLNVEHGDLKAAAAAMSIPYKTLYRNLAGPDRKDRNETVALDFIMQIVDHLERRGGDDFATLYASAVERVR